MVKIKIEKKIDIITLIVVIFIVAILIFAKTINNKEENINPGQSTAGTSSNSQINNNPSTNNNYQPKNSPLNQEEINKVGNAILSSEFVKSVPEKDPISLTFYSFESGERIWQSGFLIGRNQLLSSGTPTISLIMDSKYISQLNENNLCDIIKQANKNGDLGFESKYGTASLFLKYAGMLKYRDCFGI